MSDPLAALREKHRKLASNMRKLKARHEAALREITFLRARLARTEPHAPHPPILSGFPETYALPPAARTPRTHWKEARERLLWSGLNRAQALHLEVSCLIRLAQGQGAAHFPRLLGLAMTTGRFELTDQGPTLRDRAVTETPVKIMNPEAQIDAILAALKAAHVVHLDMHRDGRNLCVDDDGRLSLIDFDIAALDDVPFSGEIAARLQQFHAAGGYAGFGTALREIVAAHQ